MVMPYATGTSTGVVGEVVVVVGRGGVGRGVVVEVVVEVEVRSGRKRTDYGGDGEERQ